MAVGGDSNAFVYLIAEIGIRGINRNFISLKLCTKFISFSIFFFVFAITCYLLGDIHTCHLLDVKYFRNIVTLHKRKERVAATPPPALVPR